MKSWYKAAANRVLPPAQVNLEQIMVERIALYHRVTPPGDNITIYVEPFQVEDSVPAEEKIG